MSYQTGNQFDYLPRLHFWPTGTVDLDKFKQAEILDYKKQIKENRYWMSNFIRSFNNSSNPEDILEVEAKINAVTLAQVQEVAKKYLSKDKIIGVLMPE